MKIVDIDLNDASTEDIKKLGHDIANEVIVVVKKQNLTADRLVEVCGLIGEVDNRNKNQFKHEKFNEITLVTNKLNDDGEKIGLFATEELGWHSDINTREIDSVNDCASAMYIVNTGVNSITSFLNLESAYWDLSYNRKKEIENLECWIEFQNNTFYNFEGNEKEYKLYVDPNNAHVGNWKPLAFQRPSRFYNSNQTGVFWTHHFIRKFRDIKTHKEYSLEDKKELCDFLMKHVFQEKYIYHHHWENGDIVFADQFLSLHKRNKPNGDRLLWRVGMNYKEIL